MAKLTPAEIVADALCETGIAESRDEVLTEALSALTALRSSGWRLVRSDRCRNPEAGIGQCGCTETTITEEWRP